MNTMLWSADIVRRIEIMCGFIREETDYTQARQYANYCRGMIDALVIADYQEPGDDITALAESLHARTCEALISAAMETKQDCKTILDLMVKRDIHLEYGK